MNRQIEKPKYIMNALKELSYESNAEKLEYHGSTVVSDRLDVGIDALERAAGELHELRRVLGLAEWLFLDGAEYPRSCVCCRYRELQGHSESCPVKKALENHE